MIKVEPDRLYEITMRMIVRDHEVRAFKSIKFIEPREIYDPNDLIERQKELLKGTEIQVPEANGNQRANENGRDDQHHYKNPLKHLEDH
jgi:hypothetical protein